MKETNEMQNLKERAIAIKKPMTVYWPMANQREKIILEVSPDLEKGYEINNGVIVFIYRNGMTYVTRNFEVLEALKDAGYKESGLFVPFSNGEIIENAYYSELWKKMF